MIKLFQHILKNKLVMKIYGNTTIYSIKIIFTFNLLQYIIIHYILYFTLLNSLHKHFIFKIPNLSIYNNLI